MADIAPSFLPVSWAEARSRLFHEHVDALRDRCTFRASAIAVTRRQPDSALLAKDAVVTPVAAHLQVHRVCGHGQAQC